MIDQQKDERWIELQFYYICLDILSIRNDFTDITTIIDMFTMFGKYNPEEVKQITQEVLQSLRFRPAKEEFCILCHNNEVNVHYIKKRALTSNKTLYNTLAKEKNDPRMFYPRLTSKKVQIIKQFVDCFNKFKKVGLPC